MNGKMALALCFTAAFGLGACGNDNGGTFVPDGGLPSESDSGVPGVDAGCRVDPSFTSLYDTIFVSPTCNMTGCHGSFPGGNLSLAEGKVAAYSALLTQPTADTGARASFPNRVVPNNPMQSFLYRKLADMTPPGIGGRMPLGCAFQPSTCLAECEIDAVRAWIEAGAKDD